VTDLNSLTCTTNGGAAGTIAVQPASPSDNQPNSGNLITLKCAASPTDANCTHSNGEGQTYTDCNDLLGDPATESGYNAEMATSAGQSAAAALGGGTSGGFVNTDGLGCNPALGGVAFEEIMSVSGTTDQILLWQFSGTRAGRVHAQSYDTVTKPALECPTSSDPTWS
jgi:hypothetical protein